MRRRRHPHHYIWYFSRTYDDRIQIQIRVPTNACHFIMPSMHCHCHHDYCCWNHFLKREVQDFVLNSGPHPPTHPYGLGLPKVKTIFMNKLYNTIWNTGTDCDHKNKIWNQNQIWKRATDCDKRVKKKQIVIRVVGDWQARAICSHNSYAFPLWPALYDQQIKEQYVWLCYFWPFTRWLEIHPGLIRVLSAPKKCRKYNFSRDIVICVLFASPHICTVQPCAHCILIQF